MLAMMPMKGGDADLEARLAHLSDELAQARYSAEDARHQLRKKELEVSSIGEAFRKEHDALLQQLTQHEAKCREAEAQAAAEAKRADSLSACLHEQGDLAQLLEEERARCRHAEAKVSVHSVQLDLSEQRLREQDHQLAGYAALELEVHQLREENIVLQTVTNGGLRPPTITEGGQDLVHKLSDDNQRWLQAAASETPASPRSGPRHVRPEDVHSGPPASLRTRAPPAPPAPPPPAPPPPASPPRQRPLGGSLQIPPATAAQAAAGVVLWDPPRGPPTHQGDQAELPDSPVFAVPKFGSPRQKLLEWQHREAQARGAAAAGAGVSAPASPARPAPCLARVSAPTAAQPAPAAAQPALAAAQPAPAGAQLVARRGSIGKGAQPAPAAVQPAPPGVQPVLTAVLSSRRGSIGPDAFLTAPAAASPIPTWVQRVSVTGPGAVASAIQDTVSSVGQGSHRLFKERSAPVYAGLGNVLPTPASPMMLKREMTTPAGFAAPRSQQVGARVPQWHSGQRAAPAGHAVVNTQGVRTTSPHARAFQPSPRVFPRFSVAI